MKAWHLVKTYLVRREIITLQKDHLRAQMRGLENEKDLMNSSRQDLIETKRFREASSLLPLEKLALNSVALRVVEYLKESMKSIS